MGNSKTVSGVGTDTATGANWRTAAALETDSEYGTDAYVIRDLQHAGDTWQQRCSDGLTPIHFRKVFENAKGFP